MAKYRIPSDYENQTPRAGHSRVAPIYGTIHPGLAYPVHHRRLNTGDRIRGRMDQLLQSQAIRGPLMNGFKLVTIATFLPDSTIYGWMRNGKRYSPEQYFDFGKFYFNPFNASNLQYSDPSTGLFRYSRFMQRGLTMSGFTGPLSGVSAFDAWVSDEVETQPGSTARITHVGRGGLWDWLGFPAGSVYPRNGSSSSSLAAAPSMYQNLAPFFTYVLSHYYYIANMQEDYMYYTRGAGDVSVEAFYRTGAAGSLGPTAFGSVFNGISPDAFLNTVDLLAYYSASGQAAPFSQFYQGQYSSFINPVAVMLTSGLQNSGGLLSVPYTPDLFGNIIKQGSSPTANINVEDDPDGESPTGYIVGVPELRLKTKIQNMMDRVFVSGGRVGDIFRTLNGVKSSPYVNKPDFLGVWQASINPSNIRATSNGVASGEEVNLGQLAATLDKYCDFSKHSGIDYYAKEPGTFMLISMLIPQPAYCQGKHPDLDNNTFADDFNPELNGLGFTSVPRHRFTMMPRNFKTPSGSVWFSGSDTNPSSTVDPNTVSVGEEVAWSWLRTDYPHLHGDFAQNGSYQYWTLVRRFTTYGVLEAPENSFVYTDGEYTGTYINPLDWQYLFTGQTLFDQNFSLYIYADLKVTSSLSANYMPYLGR